jgi:predicted Zn-dependent protease
MKRWIALTLVLVSGGMALVVAEKQKVDAPVGPQAVLYFVADTERELTRLPVSFARLTDAEEIKIGDSLAKHYVEFFSLNEPNAETRMLAAYVEKVGMGVAARAHRKLPYKFHVIPRLDFINAFALPGGHVFIGEGLMALMDSEDELAAVLGHEVEHIDHYHCAERVQTEAALRRIPLGGLVSLPVEVFMMGYTKDQELEADREGTRLAVNAGYSPLGAIRMFEAFDRLYHERVIPARTPQEEVARVAEGTLEGYFRSHPLAAERIDAVKRLIAEQGWGNLTAERKLEVEYYFWTKKAAAALLARRYDQAARLASQSLQMNPDQPKALKTLGRAKYFLGDFSSAAQAFRDFLEHNPVDPEIVSSYAEALSYAGPTQTSVQEFSGWMSSQKSSGPTSPADVELAGLFLVAGNPSRADMLIKQAESAGAEDWAPLALGRLGWWAYRAGNYTQATDLLSRAIQRLPGRGDYQIEIGWALIEQQNLESAINRFSAAPQQGSEATMGLAVSQWLARNPDRAIELFTIAFDEDPVWSNPKWVAAVYSPHVSESIVAIQAERQKRRRKVVTSAKVEN